MSVRTLAALLLGVSLAGSCSTEEPDEVVLVSRQWVFGTKTCDARLTCRFESPGQAFRDADGRVATLEPSVMPLKYVDKPEAECGGELRRGNSVHRFDASGRDEALRQTLVFDDGGAVQLFLESFITVEDECSETVGRWVGVEGTFEGRTGTYRLVDDGLQNELVLTDS
jgi:hypothetical protein